ncbi:MAG: hypothetical protein IT585_12355 [candidate division Zixibacteria bacterium]|nr:hypothetical protein [candidate division Zixibacteria bacterium]
MSTDSMQPETIFLIGAGFTKAAFPRAPLNGQLLKELIESGADTVAKIASQNGSITEIEKLLTLHDLNLQGVRDGDFAVERRKIQHEIAEYFRQFRFEPVKLGPGKWIHQFAKVVLSNRDLIITLNYDCFLDGALDYFDVWRPRDGYCRILHPLFGIEDSSPKGIKIAKIHGSEHFGESYIHGDQGHTSLGFEVNDSIFPRSGKNRQYERGGRMRAAEYVIAPSFVKSPHIEIVYMMLDALEAVVTATRLIIIGTSLRPEDSYLWLLLTRFLTSRYACKKLIILDPYPGAILDRFDEFGFPRERAWYKIVTIEGGIETKIPELISELGR